MPTAFRAYVAARRTTRDAPAKDSISIAGGPDSPAASFNQGLSEILPAPVEDFGDPAREDFR